MKSSRSIIWIFDPLHHPDRMRETRIHPLFIVTGTKKLLPEHYASDSPAIIRESICIRADGLDKAGLLLLIQHPMILTNTGKKPGFVRC